MNIPGPQGYNDRLFASRGFRQSYHLARYNWLSRCMQERASEARSIVELGCFDAKTIDFLPQSPENYVGLDANWEGGLDIGRERFGDRPEIRLIETISATALSEFSANTFDVAIALETLEHLPDDALRAYLAEIARVTRNWFFVSVPNEMGPVFAAKYLAKRFRYGQVDNYTRSEFIDSLMFRPDKVARDEHKGFDWRLLVRTMRNDFDIASIKGVPSLGLPPSLSLTVGIVAQPKRRD